MRERAEEEVEEEGEEEGEEEEGGEGGGQFVLTKYFQCYKNGSVTPHSNPTST